MSSVQGPAFAAAVQANTAPAAKAAMPKRFMIRSSRLGSPVTFYLGWGAPDARPVLRRGAPDGGQPDFKSSLRFVALRRRPRRAAARARLGVAGRQQPGLDYR